MNSRSCTIRVSDIGREYFIRTAPNMDSTMMIGRPFSTPWRHWDGLIWILNRSFVTISIHPAKSLSTLRERRFHSHSFYYSNSETLNSIQQILRPCCPEALDPFVPFHRDASRIDPVGNCLRRRRVHQQLVQLTHVELRRIERVQCRCDLHSQLRRVERIAIGHHDMDPAALFLRIHIGGRSELG